MVCKEEGSFEIFQNHARGNTDELAGNPGFLCGGPCHYPCNNDAIRAEPADQVGYIAGIKNFRSMEDEDAGDRG
jgi:hypothetical protein